MLRQIILVVLLILLILFMLGWVALGVLLHWFYRLEDPANRTVLDKNDWKCL